MKYLISAILLLGLLAISSVALAVDYTQDANCQAAYTFNTDGGTGTTLTDDGPNSYDLTFEASGQPAWDSANNPPPDYADYNCDFVRTDYIYGSDILDWTVDWSVVAWQYPDATYYSNSSSVAVCSKDAWNNEGWAFGHKRKTTYNDTHIILHQQSGSEASSDSAIGSGGWDHTAVTYDDDGGTEIAWYLNGSTDGTDDVTWTPAGNGEGFDIGRNGNYVVGFDGHITQLGIFNRVLSSVEVSDIDTNGLAGAAAPSGYGQVIGIMIR